MIGITGYAQNGKDTTGEFLVREYGYERFSFAEPLRKLAEDIDPFIEAGDRFVRLQAYLIATGSWEEAKRCPDVRRFLQHLGTRIRERLGDDVWVNAMRIQLDEAGADLTKVVITDARFPNEADFIHEHGGKVWRVWRILPDGTPFDNGLGTDHDSEKFVADLPADEELVAANVHQLEETVRGVMKRESS